MSKPQYRLKGAARRIALIVLAGLTFLTLAAFTIVWWQARRPMVGQPEYVAMGSSFAAGIGLGSAAPGSPSICMRSLKGYPAQVSGMAGLALRDVTCSGSTTQHILDGGQAFLPPQLAAVARQTRLVTITSGGNDIGYVADLMRASAQYGVLGEVLIDNRLPPDERGYARVTANLRRIVQAIRMRAPDATIVLVTYPEIVPPTGTCPSLGVDEQVADRARVVAARLAAATRAAAHAEGVLIADMAAASIGHHACSSTPWVYGVAPDKGTAFHPNPAGARATALTVMATLDDPEMK